MTGCYYFNQWTREWFSKPYYFKFFIRNYIVIITIWYDNILLNSRRKGPSKQLFIAFYIGTFIGK